MDEVMDEPIDEPDRPGQTTQITTADLEWGKLGAVGALDVDVLPVVVQDVDTAEVVMIAYLSQEALAETARTGRAVFYSTSHLQLHWKGATSGDVLEVVELRTNCDTNSILMTVRKLGSGACHETNDDGQHFSSCFFRRLTVPDPVIEGH